MEQDIIDIVRNLMSGTLAFIGLIFTSLGIILNIKDNWKTKRLRKSDEFIHFISMNVCCVVYAVVLLLLSFVIIFCKEYKVVFLVFSTLYGVVLLLIMILLVKIVLRYKSLIVLLNDDTKPELSIEKSNIDD